MPGTLFVFQGGGPTAVINATLAGIIDKAQGRYNRILGLRHSMEPSAPENLIDLSDLMGFDQAGLRDRLAETPGALLGSSRQNVGEEALAYVVEQMRAHRATDIIGIGGNGTMCSIDLLARSASEGGYEIRAIGAPKTVDNDIPGVHVAPGYGSAARFVALAVRDFDCDFRAMQTFDDVTILDTMGRDTGWLAAAAVLLHEREGDAPHIVLVPERPFDEDRFLDAVSRRHANNGRVFVVSNEMLVDARGDIVGAAYQDGPCDPLGRPMYSLSTGTGNYLARQIWRRLGLQARCLRPGNLGRAMSCCVSRPDRDLAIGVGRQAVALLSSISAAAHMVTVNPDLSLGHRPAAEGMGRKPLPDRYLPKNAPFGIAPSFIHDMHGIIGEIDPIISFANHTVCVPK